MTGPLGSVNVFVLGDVVLDHFIPITEKQSAYQHVEGEAVYEGCRRQTSAGGAANSARLIAALGNGRTWLWGPSGDSPWGSFLHVLRQSQNVDGVSNPIIYLGPNDISRPSNTITRIVSRRGAREIHRIMRIDDIPHIPVTGPQIHDALDHLRVEGERHGVHAIVLNDLSMGALNETSASQIGAYANAKNIPLLIDPKRDWRPFASIQTACATPNLKEWCHITDQRDRDEFWRGGLNDKNCLKEMAALSNRHMPLARFHIIKCDRDGAVLIGPDKNGRRAVYHLIATLRRGVSVSDQLGAGDILTGALAIEFGRLGSPDEIYTPTALECLKRAFDVVACYLQLEWQRVPNEWEMLRSAKPIVAMGTNTTITDGLKFVPGERSINLGEMAVRSSGLVSRDETFHSVVDTLIQHLQDGWDIAGGDLKSIILTGRGGSGKTEIMKMLPSELPDCHVAVWTANSCKKTRYPDATAAMEKVGEEREKSSKRNLLIVVDEAFAKAGHLVFGDRGKMLLQLAIELHGPTRFLFVDASFATYERKHKFEASQFLSRCEILTIPELSERLHDIPLIFASMCLRNLSGNQGAIRISRRALAGVLNWMLELDPNEQSARKLHDQVKEMIKSGKTKVGKDGTLEITRTSLPPKLQDAVGPGHPSQDAELVTFFCNPMQRNVKHGGIAA